MSQTEIKHIELGDILRRYFNYSPVYNMAHKQVVDKYYHSVRRREAYKVFSPKYNIEAKLGVIHAYKTKTVFWIYVADLEIRRKSDKKAIQPLDSLPDCEYMFYGMYLNCAAFMAGVTQQPRLCMSHSTPQGVFVTEFRYNKELAEVFLESLLEEPVEQVILEV